MQYIYVLRSKKDGELYVGCTNNLRNRLRLHNSGSVQSTRYRLPFQLIYYEAYTNRKDAIEREQSFKTGWGKRYVKKILQNALRD
ncbi:MAG: GIY-YIG nuclease family protein [Candidatus Paceibacterota bacterium]